MKLPDWVLDPADRAAEILTGLILVLTFTGSLSVATSRSDTVGPMLVGALGCNLAWGIIDAVLYLTGCLAQKRKGIQTLQAVQGASDPAEAHRLIAEALPPVVASVVTPTELEAMHQRLKHAPPPPEPARLGKNDWRGAFGAFLWVFLAGFPVVIPFMLTKDSVLALRLAHGTAIALLFATGYAYGRLTGGRAWSTGISMVLLGGLLAGLTIALGG